MIENQFTEDELNEEVEEQEQPIIKVIGVGGCGGNAVNYMYNMGVKNVSFVVCNTDKQDLRKSPVPTKIQLGEKGLGAGCKPEVGLQEAQKSIEQINAILDDHTEMVFITAGMGGGTGTGAAPLIAKTAKEKGILTVAIVTIPALFEGDEKVNQALAGVEEMKKNVDAILIINSQKILDMYGDMFLDDAYSKGDEILATAAKGIAEIITLSGRMNIDMADVRTVMTDSGDAIMGAAKANGQDRAIAAIQQALDSPLLVSTNLSGAKNILLNITHSKECRITTNEVTIIRDYLSKQIDGSTKIIWGVMQDDSLGDNLGVTIVATGFDFSKQRGSSPAPQPQRVSMSAPQHVSLDGGRSGGMADRPQNNQQENVVFTISQSQPQWGRQGQPFQQSQPSHQVEHQPDPYGFYYQTDGKNGERNDRAGFDRPTEQQLGQMPHVSLDMNDNDMSTPSYQRGNAQMESQGKSDRISVLDMDEGNDSLSNRKNGFLYNNVD
ncbi:MAG: cell division protein FtsZ [Paludibacteraceae bacterium]|nr:cell division protein FtsZ [Paludibacteraceae bacterium]